MLSDLAATLPGEDCRADMRVGGLVGLSRRHTHESKRPRTAGSIRDGEDLQAAKTLTRGDVIGRRPSRPFTEDELTLALTKTTMRPAMIAPTPA